ncbi:myosin-binding protein 1-like [Magnolia sinica]|uniref:myosin-binding protein 1-like n=1 Tax=Magnolia sinica TaxID=86752 RepID=UPI002659AAD7|nr:myosin-binding protein 1-like [Magnolia sinica]XP_058105570.1 myosin-binding protein 1-like [Magnolia sinica]XP_058105571.1 myosin-binding protein 1-like [Magnolia sinica]XP_058105572.1 myosin-binding protein 1-like [Magnolia sinica]XP_058105573.1 myosin-binding protein 1-like [Magnolia sinica]
MATRKTSVTAQKDSCGFTSVLASALFEWVLIFLLFLEAFFSYLVTRFARFCELQTPCLLCSRLDHILGGEKRGFYWDLICQSHKLEISSLVYCCSHGKLTDGHGMCGDCFSSFPTNKITNYEKDRLSVAKLGSFLEYCVDDKHNIRLKLPATVDGEELVSNPSLKDLTSRSSDPRHCSCCDETLSNRDAPRSSQTKSTGVGTAELDVAGSCLMGRSHLHHRDGLKKRREKSYVSATTSYLGNPGFDPLSHVGYTELKITSDTESEVMISDDDDGISLVREASTINLEFVAQCVEPESSTILPETLPETISSNLGVEKLVHQTPKLEPSLSVPLEQFHAGEPHGVSSVTSAVVVGHGLEELNWHQAEERGNQPTTASELVDFSSAVSELGNHQTTASELVDFSSAISEFISPRGLPQSANAEKALVVISEEKLNATVIGDTAQVSVMGSGEVVKYERSTSTKSDFKTDMASNEPGPSIPSCMDLNDAYKLAIGNKGSHPLFMGKDSPRGHEDLKLLLSQISAARGFELSWNDMIPSPRLLGHGEDVKTSEASSSIGMQSLQKRPSMERNESGFDSLDGSLVSEAEGESAIDQLKRRIELDRKSMRALYKELEEERSAAAIAANQAMAMINRLQEEKAAMQMEALHYQRMMEEQAEYDQEALQKSNDLLSEKEKEIQDLEAELENYRKGLLDELMGEKIWGPRNSLNGEAGADSHSSCSDVNCHENNTDLHSNPGKTDMVHGRYNGNKVAVLKDSFFDFEDEKLYILKCLKRLQKKLHAISDNWVHVDVSGVDGSREGFPDKKFEDITQHGFNEEHLFVGDAVENGGCCREEGLQGNDTESLDPDEVTQGNNQIDHDGLQSNMSYAKTDLVAIVNEVSHLNERLRILEADRNFLVHSINSLRNGNEGVQFIQEIAGHLQELRRIGMMRREQAVA